MKSIKCLKCESQFDFEFEIKQNYFICPSCKNIFSNQNTILKFEKQQTNSMEEVIAKIGDKVILKDVNYTVVNIVEKHTNEKFYWQEYELQNFEGERIYIINEGGNWIFEKEINISDVKFNFFGENTCLYNDIDFKLFEKGSVSDFAGIGFFEYKLNVNYIRYDDYIAPPFTLSVEYEDEKTCYLGEHLPRNEVKQIFNNKNLPSKEYIGSAQPFYYNLVDVIKIFLIFSIVILGIHMVYYSYSKSELVFSGEIKPNEGNELVSNIFQLKGAIAPLTISVSSDVDNSWVATDFSLTNIETNETAYFSKDVEYYYGYSEGENWTEGSKDEEFNICGVSSGNYKIGMKSTNDFQTEFSSPVYVKVYWDKKHNWNFMLAISFFIAILILLYYIKNYFENDRWSDSPYSPYLKDENE
jgi:Domain of unknown function (DUF4178)